MQRYRDREREETLDFLFGDENLLADYRGVLFRISQPNENQVFGLFDDLELEIAADFGNTKLRELVDAMSNGDRSRLVAVAFQGYHYRYHMLLGWIGSVPALYDEKEVGADLMCHSIVVDDLPKRLRERLPPQVASQL